MQWIGWIVALIVAGVAAFLAVRLRAERLAHGRVDNERARALAEVEELRATRDLLVPAGERAMLGRVAGGVAVGIQPPLATAAADVAAVGIQLDEYRTLVKAYDNAVQYCLQPVEMIFGADKAGLDQLVKHVEDARRKLFSARAALEKSPLLAEAKQRLGSAGAAILRSSDAVVALHGATRDATAEAEIIAVNASVDAALAVAASTWDGRIEIVRDYAELPSLRGHAGELTRAFVHLALNAAESIEGGGRLTVQTRVPGPRTIEIAFTDTGRGVDDELLPNIFEPFFTTRIDAPGLGLASVRGIVKAHGGSVNVRTTPGAGSTFTVTLPVEAVPALAAAAPAR